MYEKHIATLVRLFPTEIPELAEAIDAAIELMRAAEPKDEAAELEHCYMAMERAPSWASHTSNERRDWLMRERAAARAKGYAEGFAAGRADALELRVPRDDSGF